MLMFAAVTRCDDCFRFDDMMMSSFLSSFVTSSMVLSRLNASNLLLWSKWIVLHLFILNFISHLSYHLNLKSLIILICRYSSEKFGTISKQQNVTINSIIYILDIHLKSLVSSANSRMSLSTVSDNQHCMTKWTYYNYTLETSRIRN